MKEAGDIYQQKYEDWSLDAECFKPENIEFRDDFYRPISFIGLGDPKETASKREEREERAKDICRRCPVINECLLHALENGERDGIWGGKNEDERKEMTKNKKKAS